MNVDFKNFSPEDASKIIGVHYTTIAGWCRNNLINYQDVSEIGSTRPRYSLTEKEVNKIKKLVDEYGTRKWMLYYKKDEKEVIKKEPEIINVKEETSKVETVKKLTEDQIVMKALRIRELKEHRENLEAELNQTTKEIEILQSELIDGI